MNENLKNEYLCYLMNRLGVEAEGSKGYLKLCEILVSTEFVPVIDMDWNRSKECLELRNEFAAEYNEDPSDIFGENGNMLELLTVLSERIRFGMAESDYEAPTRKWFNEMLCNCGLDEWCENQSYDAEGAEDAVRKILDTVIFRKIEWDGTGGLFPLVYSQRDQRKIELCSQMNDYLEENYDLG